MPAGCNFVGHLCCLCNDNHCQKHYQLGPENQVASSPTKNAVGNSRNYRHNTPASRTALPGSMQQYRVRPCSCHHRRYSWTDAAWPGFPHKGRPDEGVCISRIPNRKLSRLEAVAARLPLLRALRVTQPRSSRYIVPDRFADVCLSLLESCIDLDPAWEISQNDHD